MKKSNTLPKLETLIEQLTGITSIQLGKGASFVGGTPYIEEDIYEAVAAYERAYVKEAILAKRISGRQAVAYIVASLAQGSEYRDTKGTLQK